MSTMNDFGYVNIADYVSPNSGCDVSDGIQKVIDENPNRTLFFPDGEYLLSKPICTSGNPVHSVSFKLSTYAKLKATDTWTEKEALVRMGAAEPFNNITTPGSNYYFEGGILDGNGKANGISIDSGRETCIKYVSIKNTVIGVHIKHGANSGSSDCDITNVNIVGAGTPECIGVLAEGYDNTFTNMRIADVQVGIKLMSGGNYLRNIHPLHCWAKELIPVYKDSIGFEDYGRCNWYDYCYSDQLATGFVFHGDMIATMDNCFCMWWGPHGGYELGVKCLGKFNGNIKNYRVQLRADCEERKYFEVDVPGGGGVILNPVFDEKLTAETQYKEYLQGKVIFPW